MRACADTDTVICQHVGSSGHRRGRRPAPRRGRRRTLFGQLALTVVRRVGVVGVAVPTTPTSRSRCREGGLGWVAMLLDRLDFMADRGEYLSNGYGPTSARPTWLRRNFWFCTIDDPSTIDTRHRIGVEHVMLEVDYPHGDSTWPDTQTRHRGALGPHPRRRAAADDPRERRALFRHPLPPVTRP